MPTPDLTDAFELPSLVMPMSLITILCLSAIVNKLSTSARKYQWQRIHSVYLLPYQIDLQQPQQQLRKLNLAATNNHNSAQIKPSARTSPASTELIFPKAYLMVSNSLTLES